MDNFKMMVVSQGKNNFDLSMQIAFGQHPKAVGYEVSKEKGLVFYWTDHEAATKLPYEFDLQNAIDFAWGWLQKTKYPLVPDFDGDAGKGFVVFNEDWGHVSGRWQAFVAIKPVWALYGK